MSERFVTPEQAETIRQCAADLAEGAALTQQEAVFEIGRLLAEAQNPDHVLNLFRAACETFSAEDAP